MLTARRRFFDAGRARRSQQTIAPRRLVLRLEDQLAVMEVIANPRVGRSSPTQRDDVFDLKSV